MLDILIALAFAGCIYGIARAWGRRPDYRRVAGWTAAVMFAIAAWVEYSIAASGDATPSVGRLVPIMLFAVVMFRIGRKSETDDALAADVLPETRVAGWASHVRALLNRLGLEVPRESPEHRESHAAAEGG
jgi:hypothetical protein